MKYITSSLLISLILIVLTTFSACEANDTSEITLEEETEKTGLTAEEQDEIRNEILALGSETVQALEEADLDLLSRDFWQSDSTLFIIDGRKVQGYNNIKNTMQQIPNRRKAMDLDVDNEQVLVLSNETALHVVEFHQQVTLMNDSIVPGQGIWTTLYQKMGDDWKIIAVHESHLRE